MNSKNYFEKLSSAAKKAPFEQMEKASAMIMEKIDSGKWLFTCGNGGSAATASHYITDWTKMSWLSKKQKVKAMCFSDNIGVLTAYANDLAYENIFDEQLASYANSGDLLIAISGSGNSKNILKAVEKAKEIGVSTIGVTGFDGGRLHSEVDLGINFPVFDMQLCEDLHLSFGHFIMKELSS